MKKELEIKNMLDYLSSRSNGFYFRKVNGDEYTLFSSFGMKLPAEVTARDSYSLSVDFKNKVLSVYAYDESHHNGDHYNCYNCELDWNQVLSWHDALLARIKPYAKEEILKEYQDKMINIKLEKIVNGKF
jgi:hypothetical protein